MNKVYFWILPLLVGCGNNIFDPPPALTPQQTLDAIAECRRYGLEINWYDGLGPVTGYQCVAQASCKDDLPVLKGDGGKNGG